MNWFKTGCFVGVVLVATGVTLAQTLDDAYVGASNATAAAITDPAPDATPAHVASGRAELRGQSYSTGFESPFVVGWLGSQQGWSAWGSTLQPQIATTGTPYAGTQHLMIARDPNVATGTYIGGTTPAFSPAYHSGEQYQLSVQVKITATNGSSYYVEPYDSATDIVTTRVLFYYGGGIYVLEYSGGSYVWASTGYNWTANTYKELKIVQTLGANGPIQYYYGGTLIYNDLNGIAAATRLDYVNLYSDNRNSTSIGYFDNFSVTEVQVVGACCFADAHCEELTHAACSSAGGTYEGVGTNCSSFQCPPLGACCLYNGMCVIRSQAACTALSGAWQGDFTMCTLGFCPASPLDCGPSTLFSQPVADPNGSSYSSYFSDSYYAWIVYDNYVVNGPIGDLHWWGFDLAYDPNSGWSECDQLNPRFEIKFYPDDGTGRPNTAAPACTYTLVATAVDTGILYGTWHLKEYSVNLSPNCTQLSGWVSIRGSDTTPDTCLFAWLSATGGDGLAYQYNGWTLVEQNRDLAFCLTAPPTGACCFADGHCALLTHSACTLAGGTSWTEGVLCEPLNPCPQPQGACCYPDGFCAVTTQLDCQPPGVWHPEWTSCTPNPCPPPPVTGACCSTTGTCSVITQAACGTTGHYYGDNTTCRPGNKCPASCRGARTGDGQVTVAAIDRFVAARAGEPAWTHWPCPWINGDCTADQNVTFADIDPFVARIGQPCP